MTEPPQLNACPNCGLNGARCCEVETYFSEDDGDLKMNGFDIECSFCLAATETQPTEPRAIDMWNYGAVLSPDDREFERLKKIADWLGVPHPAPRPKFQPRKRDGEKPDF